MTAERLIRLLQHPEQLEFIPYEELKTLVLAYPYSHHLRQLLLLKSQQIQHHETERNLAAAAAHSLDRGLLFKRVMPSPVRQQLEVLELKPIETVLRNLEAIAPVERKELPADEPAVALVAPTPSIVAAESTPVMLPDNRSTPEPEVIAAAPETAEITETVTAEITTPEPEIIAAALETAEITETVTAEITAPEPAAGVAPPKPSFSTWVMQFNLPPIQAEQPMPKTVTPPPNPPAPRYTVPEDEDDAPVITVKEKGMAQQLAERSVAEKEEVASETLAKILVRQGHKERAISMYQRLMVANPEKSAIFAAAIEELKK